MIYKINRFIFASKWSGNARTALFSATNDLYYKPIYQPQIKTKMEERKLTEKESLEVITSMIARTKQRLAKGVGDIMLMWGYLVVCVTLLVWGLLLITKNPAVNWLWFLIWIIGGIATPIMAKKKELNATVKSYSDKLSSQVWGAVGACALALTLFCLGFAFAGRIDCWASMFAFILTIVPFGEIVQGLIIKEKSLLYGGFAGMGVGIFFLCCIAGHIVLYANWVMPLFTAAFLFTLIIPGHILNHKARQER